MDKFTEKLQSILIPISEKVSANKALRGISGGFSAMLPVVMVGAIFTLLASLNIGVYQNFITSIGLKQLFAVPASYTTDMISLYAVFCIARAEAKVFGLDDSDSFASGLIALMFFLILIPLGVSGKGAESGEVVKIAAAVPTNYLGSRGLFTAMILGILIPRLHHLFVKHNITIKMPEGVPEMISKSFAAMIPAICIGALAVVVRFLFGLTSYGSATNAIYGILQAPLAALTSNPFTFLLLLLVCNLMWFFGIHGGMVANPIRMALYSQATLANLEAYGAGRVLPNIVVNTAWFGMGNIGGSACAIGLCLNIALFAKSQRYKALNKVSLPAGLVSISEPMVFGVPMVLNPVMLIPMLLAPTVTFLLGYFAMKTGIMPYMTGAELPNGTPILLGGFLAWGSIKGAIFQAILIAVSTLIYYPFFKILDRQALAEETVVEEAE
jgi:PTS system cellobiose-specific IIC component